MGGRVSPFFAPISSPVSALNATALIRVSKLASVEASHLTSAGSSGRSRNLCKHCLWWWVHPL